VIDAGSSSLATTPDRCTLWYAAYFHPDEDVDTVEGEIRRAVSAVAAGDWWLRDHPPEVHRAMVWPPFRTDPEAPIAAVLSQALVRVQGDGPSLGPLGYVCDASFVREAGIDTVLLGPGDIRVAHSFDEHVEVDDLMIATKVYALAAAEWCRGR
jgi:acetylornithine deacetylase/succinyl-diaminopimelate desuccinylase-like protein